MEEQTQDLQNLFRNITSYLAKLNQTLGHVLIRRYQRVSRVSGISGNYANDAPFEDNSNAYLYILFVLTFYALSIIVLMVKYIRREREGTKLEFYYNEFVKRDWYKDKNLYDSVGRRIYYKIDGTKGYKEAAGTYYGTYPGMVRKASTRRSGTGTKSVMDLYMQTVTLALPVPMDDSPKIPPKTEHNDSNTNTQVLCNSANNTNSRQFADLGARPKRSSMKKNGRYSRSISISPKNSVNRKTTPPNNSSSNRINFHQQSLEDALQLRNVTSIENIKESEYTITVAKKIDRKLSVDLDPNDFDFSGMKNFDLEDDVFEDEEEENMTLDFVPSKFQTTNVDKLPARRLSREKNWQAFDHSGKDDNSDEDEDDDEDKNIGKYSRKNSVKLISRVFSDEDVQHHAKTFQVKSNIDTIPARRLSHEANWQMLSSNTPVIEEETTTGSPSSADFLSNRKSIIIHFGSLEEESFDNSVFENDSISTAV